MMTTAKKYFNQQLKNPEFRKYYIEEKEKLDMEYSFEKLKNDIIEQKPTKDIISSIDKIKRTMFRNLRLKATI
jgi:hypothetical protein